MLYEIAKLFGNFGNFMDVITNALLMVYVLRLATHFRSPL